MDNRSALNFGLPMSMILHTRIQHCTLKDKISRGVSFINKSTFELTITTTFYHQHNLHNFSSALYSIGRHSPQILERRVAGEIRL